MFEPNKPVTTGGPLIDVQNASKKFIIHKDRSRSIQEQFIRALRARKRAPSVDGQGATDREEFWALRDISFTVNPGDSLGIIGPNGSGKSTLLKLLVGILEPTEGTVKIRGRISSLLELGAGFHTDLTGRDNVFLNGSIYGLSQQQIRDRMESIIDFSGIGPFIDMPVKHYSSGMYVRLGFAVAIHTEPDLLLVDEVLAVGDAAFQHKCMDAIQRFRTAGGTMILVSHDLGTIQTQCDRAIWLDRGKVGADGHPTDVVMAYLNKVAEKEEAEADIDTLPELPEGQRWGTGRLRVDRVRLCDDKGIERVNFVNGGPLTIELHYTAKEAIESPVFGIAIHHHNGTHVTGPNTKFANLYIPQVAGKGIVRHIIPALTLLEGGYNISVAVVDDGDTEMFDYHDRAYSFRVYPGQSGERYGLVTLNGTWDVKSEVEVEVEVEVEAEVEVEVEGKSG
ncbi:MAG: ABC transporter ATP-binding protein [Caldilineaceae bacterium]|nr:ABC transporter ATP-binding protein [Caldilineaceae bacterium]MBP8106876.1 ABC transporter ATP-binding protein [Caldilineaceae bacterium]MBP8122434.1 ABC transporter ATP-binding protein [Caldilineaceae bacterium]MBP9072244.1 ABC transporter ATP-binding protein [Caldilineaceae bacterium]